MQIVVFETFEEQAHGLQHKPYIEDNTLWVFPYVSNGSVFHSRNVPEPFDLAFLDIELRIIGIWTITPPHEIIRVPRNTAMALESKGNRMVAWGFVPGRIARF